MTLHEDHARRMFAARASGDATPFQSLKAAAVWVSEWLQSCADHYAAAALYDSLSRLSDTDLDRCGLSRTTLAHDLIHMRESAVATRTTPAPVDRERAPGSPQSLQQQEGTAVR